VASIPDLIFFWGKFEDVLDLDHLIGKILLLVASHLGSTQEKVGVGGRC
jgi:hypothetical protein